MNTVESQTVATNEANFGDVMRAIQADLQYHINEVWDELRKSDAILTALNIQLEKKNVDQDRIEALVEVTLLSIEKAKSACDDTDVEMVCLHRATRQACEDQQRRDIVLEALTTATRPDASMEELERQANRIGAVADGDERFVESWEAFKRIVISRGLNVSVSRQSDGTLDGVHVYDGTSARLSEEKARRIDEIARSWHGQTGASGGDHVA